jgi:hypothetical protein
MKNYRLEKLCSRILKNIKHDTFLIYPSLNI